MTLSLLAAVALAGPATQSFSVLFLGPAEHGRETIERSEAIRDRLPLPGMRKGASPLSPRWFRSCVHQDTLDGMEQCVRPILGQRLMVDRTPVVLVLTRANGARRLEWRCLGARSSHAAVLDEDGVDKRATNCIAAAVADCRSPQAER